MVLLNCFSGCTAMEVLYELELTLKDLYPDTDPSDGEKWRQKLAAKRKADIRDKESMDLWISLTILAQVVGARIFGGDDHPKNKTELWQKEAQAVRMLPGQFREYYK